MPQNESRVNEVRAEIDSDLLETAEANDVDPNEVITTKLEEFSGYGAGTIAGFASGSIRDQIQAAKADDLKGIVVGSRDWMGSEGPRRYALVRSSEPNRELSSFSPTVTGPDGADVQIPTEGAIVHFQATFNEQYENYDIDGIKGAKPLDYPELVSQLSTVAGSPSDLTMADEDTLVVVQGTIGFVDPIEELEDVSADGDDPNWEVTEKYDVVAEDNRNPPRTNPRFQVTLDRDDGATVRGEIDQQRMGEPFVRLQDLDMLLGDALDRGDPDAQASFLQDGLRGRDVIMVGRVYSFDETTTDEGEHREYFNLSLSALFETDLDSAQQTIADAAESPDESPAEAGDEAGDEDGEEEGDDEDLEDFDEFEGDDEADEPDADDPHICDECGDEFDTPQGLASHSRVHKDDEDDEVKSGEIGEVRDDIEQYADLTGEDLADLTVADVNDALDMDDVPDVVIDKALEDDAPEASGGSDSDEPYAAILDGGEYHCPIGEHIDNLGVCPASESDIAALAAHMDEMHGGHLDQPGQQFLKEHYE